MFYFQLIKDVVKIIKILNVLSDKAETDIDNYIDSICALLRIFKYPFFKEKSSDELVYGSVIVECIANIGKQRLIKIKKRLTFQMELTPASRLFISDT